MKKQRKRYTPERVAIRKRHLVEGVICPRIGRIRGMGGNYRCGKTKPRS